MATQKRADGPSACSIWQWANPLVTRYAQFTPIDLFIFIKPHKHPNHENQPVLLEFLTQVNFRQQFH